MKWLYNSPPTASERSQGVCREGWVQPSQLSHCSVKGLTEQWFSPDDLGWLRPFGSLEELCLPSPYRPGSVLQTHLRERSCWNWMTIMQEVDWQKNPSSIGKLCWKRQPQTVVCHMGSSYSRSIWCVILFSYHFLHSSWDSMRPVASWEILDEWKRWDERDCWI